ncbi:Hint domain-containing protein [Lysobacter cavernae]|uniref:Hint domain-containing protein n=1 Tax=Lysobacter cavernae TaxID=1685901 RepID=A0ABV7RL50_9GAMM
MPTGISTTLNGTTINGVTYYGAVDLDTVFHLRNGQAPAANVGIASPSGRDMSDWFVPLTAGGTQLEVDTGIRTGAGAGVDLRTLYAKAGTIGTPGGGGGGGGSGGCLPFETPVLLWEQGTKPLGEIRPGDVVIGYYVDGLADESSPGWEAWTMPRERVASGTLIPVTVVTTMVSEYPRHYLVNGALRATYEHTFLVLRGAEWGWQRAEHLRPGDAFLSEDLGEVAIESVELVEHPMRVANINVEEVDNFLFVAFDGLSILSHNPTDKN